MRRKPRSSAEADRARKELWITEQLKSAPVMSDEQRELIETLLALCIADQKAA